MITKEEFDKFEQVGVMVDGAIIRRYPGSGSCVWDPGLNYPAAPFAYSIRNIKANWWLND